MAKKKQQAAKSEPTILENGALLVYSYHPVTRAFVGTEQAFPDPLTPGEFLLPAGSTTIAPPSRENGKVRKWDGSEWVQENIPVEQPVQAPEESEEQKAANGRATRNGLLLQCDWTQLPDVALTTAQKAAWATYRQALRDVPQQEDFPTTINWPTQP